MGEEDRGRLPRPKLRQQHPVCSRIPKKMILFLVATKMSGNATHIGIYPRAAVVVELTSSVNATLTNQILSAHHSPLLM